MALETRSSSAIKTRKCSFTFRVECLIVAFETNPMSCIDLLLFSVISFYFLSLTAIQSRSRSLVKLG
jgi:hypothetical protein